MMRSIRTRTKVVYPEGGPSYDKWDYFEIDNEAWAELPSLNESYDSLNEWGYWVRGHQEITQEQEDWIDSHPEHHGSQSENVQELITSISHYS